MKRFKNIFSHMPIRYKLALYFLGFVFVMLAFLWTFQIVFLDSFYKTIKTNQIESCANSIYQNIKNEQIEMLIEEIHNQNDINVMIFDVQSGNFVKVYSTEGIAVTGNPNIFNHTIDPSLVRYYNSAVKNGGTTIEITTIKNKNFDGFMGDEPPFERIGTQNLVYSKVFDIETGQNYENSDKAQKTECMLILTSMITPVSSTTETLRIQLVIITVILLILAIVLAISVSRKISKPISKINKAAKELAKQNYSVEFDGKGYLEIAELNDTLKYAAQELSKVDALRKELIANISHDLRTPLTMITGYSEAMRDLPGENTPENVQIVIDEARRLSSLVTDLLDISRLQTGATQMQKRKFSLTDNIKSIFKRYSKLTEQDGYHIEFLYDENVDILADEIKIGQVIYNLVNNAINYAGEDKTVIVRQIVNDGIVKIEVEDHGNGIEPENLEYIWDRYYKVDKEHKSPVIGTGLGLSIVKNILDLHGAHYGVTSQIGKGSIFWFDLKIAQSKTDDKEKE